MIRLVLFGECCITVWDVRLESIWRAAQHNRLVNVVIMGDHPQLQSTLRARCYPAFSH